MMRVNRGGDTSRSGHARLQLQQRYATPDAAIEALVAAVRADDTARIGAVLGPGSDSLINSGDTVADRHARVRFAAAFDQRSRIEFAGDAKATLIIGNNDWPLPFPLVKAADGWRFDTESGAEEILNRRIGRNELSAIQVCLAYVGCPTRIRVDAG